MNLSLSFRLFTLLALVALPLSFAAAGELSTIINGKSIHVGATEDWNENNYGLGFEYEFSSHSRWKKRVMVNGFRDSNSDMSYMVGAGLHRTLFATDRLHGFHVDVGVNAFVMTRKDVNNNRPFPGALPSLSVSNRYVGVNLTYLPRKAVEKLSSTEMADDTLSGIVFMQFKLNVSEIFLRE